MAGARAPGSGTIDRMGTDVPDQKFTGADRVRFRRQVSRGTEAIARMLSEGLFTDHGAPPEPLLGMEVELNLVDAEMNPAMANAAVLDAIADPDYQTEPVSYTHLTLPTNREV